MKSYSAEHIHMDPNEIKELLDLKYEQFNVPGFIPEDPILIPHRFSKKEDIEISAFLSAIIAWGRRSMIIKNASRMIELMDNAPFDFITHAKEGDFKKFSHFVHRTFNGIDLISFLYRLQFVYKNKGGLEAIFTLTNNPHPYNVYENINQARKIFTDDVNFPSRTHKHFANPQKGSSAKRINMFLRWMVRKDNRGVDFGLWDHISPKSLICPLDVHTGNVARKLGLLKRKQNDWKAAVELTEFLKKFCPEDPVKYDFSLFGLGIIDSF